MKTNVLGLIISVVVGIILLGSLLAPVLADAEKTIGAPVTYTNEGYGYTMDVMNSASATAIATGTENSYTINGVEVESATGFNLPMIVTDNVAIQAAASGSGNLLMIRSASGINSISSSSATTVTITADNGTITVDNSGVASTYTYSWMLAISEDGKYIESGTLRSRYLAENEQPIVYGYNAGLGYYTSYNGETKASSGTDVTLSYNESLVDGTTDVYQTSAEGATIGSISPAAAIVPLKVTGHSEDGSTALISAILPISVISIVVMAVGFILRSRQD